MSDIRSTSQIRRLTVELQNAEKTIHDLQKAVSEIIEAGRVKHKSMRDQMDLLRTDKITLTEELDKIKSVQSAVPPPLPSPEKASQSQLSTASAAINWHL